MMSYTKQVSHQEKRTRKQRFITALVKRHLSSDMPNIKKHSITSNSKLIQNYQTNIEILNHQKKTLNISWEIFGTHKSYNRSSKRCLLCPNEKLAIALHRDDNMLRKIGSDKQVQARKLANYMLANYDSKD